MHAAALENAPPGPQHWAYWLKLDAKSLISETDASEMAPSKKLFPPNAHWRVMVDKHDWAAGAVEHMVLNAGPSWQSPEVGKGIELDEVVAFVVIAEQSTTESAPSTRIISEQLIV